MISLTQTITRSPEVLVQEVAQETVLLDLQSEHYFGLNEMGTRIWQLLESQNNLEKITEILLVEFDVEKQQLESDLKSLITELAEMGLVQLNPQ